VVCELIGSPVVSLRYEQLRSPRKQAWAGALPGCLAAWALEDTLVKGGSSVGSDRGVPLNEEGASGALSAV
jgi:hypothetical protein